MSKTIRKGQLFSRKSDGFVFRVESASRAKDGAAMQCVDAARIFGWFSTADITRDFDAVTATRPATRARAEAASWAWLAPWAR